MKMKVILLKDVPGAGRRNEIKEVSAGFAMNFLMPNRLALRATESAVLKIELEKTKNQAEVGIQETLLLKNLEDLNGSEIVIREKANEEGHLFAGIHKKEVCEEIKKQLNLEIPIDCINLERPIKSTGEIKIEASHAGKNVFFNLSIRDLDK